MHELIKHISSDESICRDATGAADRAELVSNAEYFITHKIITRETTAWNIDTNSLGTEI